MRDRGQRGYATAEILMAMVLVAILGVAIVILIFSGSETYQRINTNKNAEIDARNALAYVNIKVRQNDMAGNVAVETMPDTGEKALVIRQVVDTEVYQTWIFFQEGQLWECMVLEGEEPHQNLSFRLVGAEDFAVAMEDGRLAVSVSYSYSGEPVVLHSQIYIRSGEQAA
jgi:type II secretory pathway component PulJ